MNRKPNTHRNEKPGGGHAILLDLSRSLFFWKTLKLVLHNRLTVSILLVQFIQGGTVMEFQVDVASREPIYRQLRSQIRQAVARARLQPGDQLPSVRELSGRLVVNPNTVARVYTELEREGVLNTRPGLGVFVAQLKTEITKKARRQRFQELLDEFLTEAVHLGLSGEEVLDAVTKGAKKFAWQTQ